MSTFSAIDVYVSIRQHVSNRKDSYLFCCCKRSYSFKFNEYFSYRKVYRSTLLSHVDKLIDIFWLLTRIHISYSIYTRIAISRVNLTRKSETKRNLFDIIVIINEEINWEIIFFRIFIFSATIITTYWNRSSSSIRMKR